MTIFLGELARTDSFEREQGKKEGAATRGKKKKRIPAG
jgi:hypothetical protein